MFRLERRRVVDLGLGRRQGGHGIQARRQFPRGERILQLDWKNVKLKRQQQKQQQQLVKAKKILQNLIVFMVRCIKGTVHIIIRLRIMAFI